MSDTYTINITGSNNDTDLNVNGSSAAAAAASSVSVSNALEEFSTLSKIQIPALAGTGVADQSMPGLAHKFKSGEHYVYFYVPQGGPQGTLNVANLVCIDVKTEQIVWSRRGIQPQSLSGENLDAATSNEFLWSANLTNADASYPTAAIGGYPHPMAAAMFTASLGGGRNTPFIDAKDLIWVSSNGAGGAWIAAFDAKTGAHKHNVDIQGSLSGDYMGNSWNSFALVGNKIQLIRSGVAVEYENDSPVVYFGLTPMYEYIFNNFAAPTDFDLPGVHGLQGSFNKWSIASNAYVWSLNTCPEEIIPQGQTIPQECFRAGQTLLKTRIPLFELLDGSGTVVFGDNLATSGYKIGPEVKIQVKHADGTSTKETFTFSQGAGLSVDLSYTSANGITKTGQELVEMYYGLGYNQQTGGMDPLYTPNMIEIEIDNTYVLSDVATTAPTSAVSPAWGRNHFIAFDQNYYSAGPWGQGFVINENTISFVAGNGTHSPWDEYFFLDGICSNVTTVALSLGAGNITLDQYKAAMKNMEQDALLSPRGRRALFNAMVTVSKSDGALLQYKKAISYDSFDIAVMGGFNGLVPGATGTYGQPGGKPHERESGPDSDNGGGVVGGKFIGSYTKGGIALTQEVTGLAHLIAVGPESTPGHMNSGCDLSANQPKSSLTVGGVAGVVGGNNLGLSTDGTRMYATIVNPRSYIGDFTVDVGFLNPGPAGSNPDWITAAGDSIPGGTSYVSAINLKDGSIAWESPVANGGSHCPPVYADGRVWAGSIKDVNAAGHSSPCVKAFNAKTGKLEADVKVEAACMAGPVAVTPDLLYLLPGRASGYDSANASPGDGAIRILRSKNSPP